MFSYLSTLYVPYVRPVVDIHVLSTIYVRHKEVGKSKAILNLVE